MVYQSSGSSAGRRERKRGFSLGISWLLPRSTLAGLLSILLAATLVVLLWFGGFSGVSKNNGDTGSGSRTGSESGFDSASKVRIGGSVEQHRSGEGSAAAEIMREHDVSLHEQNPVKVSSSLLTPLIPKDVLDAADRISISDNHAQVLDWNLFYREVKPLASSSAKFDILLLHGQAFSSENWVDIKTLNILAAAGYHVIAVDLPGYGHTGGDSVPQKLKADFIAEILKVLNLRKPVLVSPSMSGTFSLPFIFENPQSLSAFVPVAPVGSGEFSKQQYENLKLPTLIVYGDRDTSLGTMSLSNLKHLSNSHVFKVPNAGHAAYLNQPDLFHTVLINFLKMLQQNT